jgi:hypothetical protein
MPFGFLLIALGAFGTLYSASYTEMVGATIVLATGMGWLSAGLLPLALVTMPLPLQGTAVGVFGSFEDLGLLVGPIVLSSAYAAYGVDSMFLLVGLLALAGAVLAWVVWLVRWGPWRTPGPQAVGR